MVQHCCAIGCTKSSDVFRTFKFHGFPLNNKPLLQKWIRAVRRKDFTPTKSTKICSDHFVKDDYSGRVLKPNAVPSIFNFKAATGKKSTKKILADEEDVSQIVKVEWDPLNELGLDGNQVELHFEDEIIEQKIINNTFGKEMGTQTVVINKCKLCENTRDKFKLLHKQIKRRDDKITKMQNLITSLKNQIAESKKRKIKIVGNSIMLVDKLDNNKSLNNISFNEECEIALSVS